MNNSPPHVSVIICTCGRGDAVVASIASVLRIEDPPFELLVIDQSPDDATERALLPFSRDVRLRYVRTPERGKDRALNLGLRLARAEIIACTDDDCETPPDWLSGMVQVLVEHPEAALVFSTVRAGPLDISAGFIPVFQAPPFTKLSSLRDWRGPHGIGAAMAFRKAIIQAIGGFDEMLGPGASFPAFEDGDVALRALAAGHAVIQTDSVFVVHHGFRTWEQGRELAKRDYLGIGAVMGKLVRCRQKGAAGIAAGYFWREVVQPIPAHVIRLRKPPVMNRAMTLARGFRAGWRTPSDPRALLFLPPAAATTPSLAEDARSRPPSAPDEERPAQAEAPPGRV